MRQSVEARVSWNVWREDGGLWAGEARTFGGEQIAATNGKATSWEVQAFLRRAIERFAALAAA